MNLNDDKHSLLPKGIKKIIFYEHSLADADYSYFQSIFDFYSIYGSEVRIEFCFFVFDDNLKEVIIKGQLESVTKLLSKYGNTMNNDNHGKNLIHKLLLGNRVQISEVDILGKRINSVENN